MPGALGAEERYAWYSYRTGSFCSCRTAGHWSSGDDGCLVQDGRLVPGLHGSAGFCSNGDDGGDVPLDAPPLGLSCADLGSPQRMGKRRGRSGWGSAGVRRIGKCSGGFGEAAAGFGEVAAGSTNSDGSRRGRRMGKEDRQRYCGKECSVSSLVWLWVLLSNRIHFYTL